MPAKKERTEKLVALVEHLIETEPFERDGLKWACRPLSYYAEHFGVVTRTISRRFRKAPFQTRPAHTGDWALVNGVGQLTGGSPVCLVRIGDGITRNHAKNIMAKLFADKFPGYVAADPIRWENDKRRLYRIAGDLPGQFGVEVFKWTLANWTTAAAAMKFAAEATPGYKPRFWQLPNIGYICHFTMACAHAYVVAQMEAKKIPPDKLNVAAAFLNATDPTEGHPGDTSTIEQLIALADLNPLIAKPLPASAKKCPS